MEELGKQPKGTDGHTLAAVSSLGAVREGEVGDAEAALAVVVRTSIELMVSVTERSLAAATILLSGAPTAVYFAEVEKTICVHMKYYWHGEI